MRNVSPFDSPCHRDNIFISVAWVLYYGKDTDWQNWTHYTRRDSTARMGLLKTAHLCLVHLSHLVHSFLRTSENRGGGGGPWNVCNLLDQWKIRGISSPGVCMHGKRGLWRRELDLSGDWKGWNKQPDGHICQAWTEQGLRCHSSPVKIARDNWGWSVSTWLDHQTCWQTVRLRDVTVLQGNGGADLSPLESLQLCLHNVCSASAGNWALHASQTVILLSDQWQCVVRPESLECLSSCKKYNFFQHQNCDKQVSGQKHLELNHVSIQLSYSLS